MTVIYDFSAASARQSNAGLRTIWEPRGVLRSTMNKFRFSANLFSSTQYHLLCSSPVGKSGFKHKNGHWQCYDNRGFPISTIYLQVRAIFCRRMRTIKHSSATVSPRFISVQKAELYPGQSPTFSHLQASLLSSASARNRQLYRGTLGCPSFFQSSSRNEADDPVGPETEKSMACFYCASCFHRHVWLHSK